MGTIAELTSKIKAANALGRKNLSNKGIDVEETATTYEIMSKIADVSVGETVDLLPYAVTARTLFSKATSFPSKAVVNLSNAKDVYQAFSYWNINPIPIVEELTVNAPNVNVGNNQGCMGQMFYMNNGVKKVTLNMPDGCMYMNGTFSNCGILEEVVLNFSTENILDYSSAFVNSRKLIRILGVLDFSSATNANYMFASCGALEEVRFAPDTLSISMSLNGSGNLTSESIQSIIDGLATVETTQTLTLHSSAVLKLTDEQLQIAEEKNWTIK